MQKVLLNKIIFAFIIRMRKMAKTRKSTRGGERLDESYFNMGPYESDYLTVRRLSHSAMYAIVKNPEKYNLTDIQHKIIGDAVHKYTIEKMEKRKKKEYSFFWKKTLQHHLNNAYKNKDITANLFRNDTLIPSSWDPLPKNSLWDTLTEEQLIKYSPEFNNRKYLDLYKVLKKIRNRLPAGGSAEWFLENELKKLYGFKEIPKHFYEPYPEEPLGPNGRERTTTHRTTTRRNSSNNNEPPYPQSNY